ncbi:hypothetical protein EA655_11365 [Pseudoxanthomonas winnipegensis]|uniref:Uncharacterized protein n=1 Tax=Pseudoxanthomonas winnipegensis TaxID=2480810 RepID=A0A4Q8M2J3_9GAMM|nr:hypothetical protein EA655_11365 [Pseudoxanthomonas winnipegensis]
MQNTLCAGKKCLQTHTFENQTRAIKPARMALSNLKRETKTAGGPKQQGNQCVHWHCKQDQNQKLVAR